ncbi:MAG: prephenate dehydrogenase [Anaerolineales bacterium]|nr:prephenate dehydrogenase [Anaerolineales bacterium]MCS7246857.1 prephenate dehydrogenase [Anaerolineales bacterium]MDW8160667.1 prephenate dehydrogenase [Anaerolineales bacterium]MDW8445815.1 prephenate dehydrogenase [Anaerolineales bacterium]
MNSQLPLSLAHCRVLIVGLGLMGASLALALRGKCKALYGVDRNEDTCRLALMHEVVDAVWQDATKTRPVDMMILAVPVGQILGLLEQINEAILTPTVIMDVGSTKTVICRAMEKLAEHLDPIGGHPMCGKETLGIQSADAAIYQGAPFALVPLERTSSYAKSLAEQLVAAIGSRVVWLDAETHDRIVAAVSHLPYLLASALTLSVPLELTSLIGPGFRSSTRLAATPTTMMLDVLKTNRSFILEAVERVEEELSRLKAYLYREEYELLNSRLNVAAEHLQRILQKE